ncbi:hypothetical protein HanRHA438_Chr02g0048181 [Helianthus annuus]|nr:hypothetical protein HanRHA438_Chr02g0048181 [Helianthus annuus]
MHEFKLAKMLDIVENREQHKLLADIKLTREVQHMKYFVEIEKSKYLNVLSQPHENTGMG